MVQTDWKRLDLHNFDSKAALRSEAAISFEKLGHFYRPGQWVYRNYCASIARGSIFALLGPNGCGKTTLLQTLLGARPPSEGALSVKGEKAFVPQLFQVSFDYTVLDMVLMGRAKKIGLFSQPSRIDKEIARAALDRFGLADAAYRPFHEMSGGQRQLVIFARVLVAEADILILDEPTSALDLKNQILILDWIAKLAMESGLTVVMTTHHPHHALAVADHTLLMMGESSYICGPTSGILTEGNLTTLYEAPIRRISFEHNGRSVEILTPVLVSRTSREI